MFAICFDVNREVFVVLRIREAVVFFEPVDLRFTDRWNLAFVRVERCQTFRSRSVAANGSKCVDQVFRLRFFCRRANIDIGNAEAFGELEPKLGMIR